MLKSMTIAVSAVCLSGLLAAPTRADSIQIGSFGTTQKAANVGTAAESVVYEVLGDGVLSSLTYSINFTPDSTTNLLDGTGVYALSAGGVTLNSLDFTFALAPGTISPDGMSEALSGNATLTGGTGGYAGAFGTGTFDINYLLVDPTAFAYSSSLLSATYTLLPTGPNSAVPLPKSASAGLMLLGLLVPAKWMSRRKIAV